jgi:hypothetical protein
MLNKRLWINDKIGQFTIAVMKAYQQSDESENVPITKEWAFDYIQAEILKIHVQAEELFGDDE